jgi:hypothetical protein
MASFGREIFPVLDAEGAPRTGLASLIVWLSIYSVNSSGTATIVSTAGDKPTFSEIGTTGIYIVGAGANNGAIPSDTRLVGFIDCGTGSVPRYRFFDSKYSDRQEPALQSDVSILVDGTNGNAAIKTVAANTYNIVNNGTYGNSALNTLLTGSNGLANIKSDTATIISDTSTLKTDTGLIKGYVYDSGSATSTIGLLRDGTNGLSAIKGSVYSGGVSVWTKADSTNSIVSSVTYGNQVIQELLVDGTNGLASIKTSAASAASSASTASSNTTSIIGYVYNSGTSTIGLLQDGTNGLAAIKSVAASADTAATAARKVATNRWNVATNQLVIYDDNGSTVLYRFNLFDADGNPTSTDITQRQVTTP